MQMMKVKYLKSIPAVFFLLLTTRVLAPSITIGCILTAEPENPYDNLIRAVVQVESLGDTLAFNAKEEAIGAFQIRPIRILDYNRRTGSNYKLQNCINYELSKKIFLYYAHRTGLHDYEKIARNWNGSGKNTLDYWEKIKKYL
jgi:hypothetical protein